MTLPCPKTETRAPPPRAQVALLNDFHPLPPLPKCPVVGGTVAGEAFYHVCVSDWHMHVLDDDRVVLEVPLLDIKDMVRACARACVRMDLFAGEEGGWV